MDKQEIDLKKLIDRVNAITVNQKEVEKKTFKDYLLDKQEKGQYQNYMISFEEADDYTFFKKLLDNLGVDVIEIF